MKSNKSMMGAVLAGIGASACCTLPIAASLLGIGFLSTIGQFIKSYRVVFLVLAFGLLSFSTFLIFLKPWLEQRRANKAGVVCDCKMPSKSTKTVMILVAIFTIGAAFFPEFSGRLLANDSTSIKNQKPSLIATVSISGMTCQGCANSIEKSLSKVDIVQKAVVSYENRQATVELKIPDREKSEKLIKEKINSFGYKVTKIDWSKP